MARPPKTPPSPPTARPTAGALAAVAEPPLRWLCVVAVAAAAAAGIVAAAAPAGCWYEDRLHAEGRPVATREPCLSCACSRGSLRCVLRVCAALPDPPPPGCVLLRRRGACCPQLHCHDGREEVPQSNMEELLQLPEGITGGQGCAWGGTLYAEGSAMATSSLCEYCYCIRGRQRCVRPRCLLPLPLPGCTPRYKQHACCPAHYDCSEANEAIANATTTSRIPVQVAGCEFNNKWYKDGDMVKQQNNKCENCFCMKGKIECVPLSCAPPLQGCQPIITRGNCCPAIYNCSSENTNLLSSQLLSRNDDINPLAQENNQSYDASVISRGHTPKASVENPLQTDLTASKLLLAFEGRSHREMPGKANSSAGENHKISPCNITKIEEENKGENNKEGQEEEKEKKEEEGKKEEGTTETTTSLENKDSTTITTTTEMINETTSLATETSTQLTTEISTLPTTTTINSENSTNETTETESSTTSTIFTTTTMQSTQTTTAAATKTTTVATAATKTTAAAVATKTSTAGGATKTTTTAATAATTTTPTTKTDKGVSKETLRNETRIQERIAPPTDASSTFPDDVITLGPDGNIDIERAGITTEQNAPISVQTDSTFMTLIPTTVIMPEELDVVNITLHKNVSIVENDNSSTTVNGSQQPVRAIPPEIEAILNITQKKDEDYEYDYNEPSLPPSLPGVRIIPFVAADAVVEDKNSPTVYPKDKHRPTDTPIFYKVSHPNLFSPPVETEGGFIPREPLLDGPFYESKFDGPYHTTGINVQPGQMPLDITSGTIMPPAITIPPKTEDERCLSNGKEYRHGELLAQTDPCLRCICYYGEVLCQATKCPPLKPGCRRLRHKDRRSCCGRLVCGDSGESPTVVLDRADGTLRPSILQPAAGSLLGPVVPPITVADGVVTPDPFRDVIRTEKAPDLPALIGDIMPYLLERRTMSPLPAATSPMLPATAATSPPASAATPAFTQSSTPTISSVPPTTTPLAPVFTTSSASPLTTGSSSESSAFTQTTSVATTSKTTNSVFSSKISSPITKSNDTIEVSSPVSLLTTERTTTTTTIPDIAASKNDYDVEDDDSEFSFDSVLQFLFSGDSTTKSSTKSSRPPQPPSTTRKTTTSLPVPTSTTPLDVATKSTQESTSTDAGTESTTAESVSTINTTQHILEIFNISLHVTGESDGTSSPGTPGADAGGGIGGNSIGEIPADPGAASGLLKLAGCNIYGRMYRVGRIISELSGPCLECMCTEVGVQCRALDC